MNELRNRQEATFHEAEPTSDGMAAAQAADTREGELLVSVLKLEEDVRKLFRAARLRSVLLLLGLAGLVVLTAFAHRLLPDGAFVCWVFFVVQIESCGLKAGLRLALSNHCPALFPSLSHPA